MFIFFPSKFSFLNFFFFFFFVFSFLISTAPITIFSEKIRLLFPLIFLIFKLFLSFIFVEKLVKFELISDKSEFFFLNFFSLSILQNFSTYLFEETLYCNLLGSIFVLFKNDFISSGTVNLMGWGLGTILLVFDKLIFCV